MNIAFKNIKMEKVPGINVRNNEKICPFMGFPLFFLKNQKISNKQFLIVAEGQFLVNFHFILQKTIEAQTVDEWI